MSFINKIVQWFRDLFVSFYKSPVEESSEEPYEDSSDSTYQVRLRNCIKWYSLVDSKITWEQNTVSLPEALGYHEEYVIESNSTGTVKFILETSIRCNDGEVLPHLRYAEYLTPGIHIINITAESLGLAPITFSATVDDFEPVSTRRITI